MAQRGSSWQLALTDRMSGPARAMTAAVSKLASGMDRMAAASDRAAARAAAAAKRISDAVDSLASAKRGPQRASRAMDLLGRSVREIQRNTVAQGAASGGTFEHMASGLSSVATAAAVAAGAVSVLARAASSGIRETVGLVSFQQDSMAVLETMLGSASAARREFQRSLDIADASPLDTRDVISMRQRLTTSGFTNERERDVMSAALSDVASLRGMDAANHALLGFSQMRAMGSMGMQDFGQIREATGINQRQVFLSIARARGMQGSEDAQVRAISQLISQRRISSDEGIRASLEALAGQMGGGPLGTITERLGSTITGRLSTVKSAITSLLLSVDLTRIPGVQMFSRALENVGRLLARSNPLAQRLRDSLTTLIDRGFTALFGSLGSSGGQARLEAFLRAAITGIDSLSATIERVAPRARGFFSGLETGLAPVARMLLAINGGQREGTGAIEQSATAWQRFGERLGAVVSVVSGALAVFYNFGQILVSVVTFPARIAANALNVLWTQISQFVSGGLSLRDTGYNLMMGFVEGIWDAFGVVIGTIHEAFTSVVAAGRAALGIQSPSREFAYLGEMSAAGFAQGIEGGAGDAQGAMRDMMAPPGVGGMLGAGGGVNITIHIDGASDPQTTAEAVRASLVDLFEGLSPEAA